MFRFGSSAEPWGPLRKMLRNTKVSCCPAVARQRPSAVQESLQLGPGLGRRAGTHSSAPAGGAGPRGQGGASADLREPEGGSQEGREAPTSWLQGTGAQAATVAAAPKPSP